DPELEQLAVYPRCAPQRVGDAHLADQVANLRRYRRPTTERPRFPAPIDSKPSSVPMQKGSWSNDFQGVQHPGSQPIQRNKQQPVDAAEGYSLGGTAMQHVELMSQHKNFGLQCSS